MSALKSIAEMERIRAANSIIRQAEIKAFVPEKNAYKPVAYFEIDRYIAGDFRGLFLVAQFTPAEGKKKAERKVIAEGVDLVVAVSTLETCLRRRVFK